MKRQHFLEPDPESGTLGETRSSILEVLQDTGARLGVSDVATRLSLHPNTVRFHLDALTASGLVDTEAEERALPGRPRTLYSANANSASAGRRHFRLLAEILASSMAAQTLHPREAAINAGQEWGRYLGEGPLPFTHVDANEATQRLVRVMEDIGFAPEAVTKGRRRQVLLHRCPFREVAQEHPEVVCSIHLGLMNGLLTELDAPVEVERLDPFVEPAQCVASLSRRSPGAERSKRPRRATTKAPQAALNALA